MSDRDDSNSTILNLSVIIFGFSFTYGEGTADYGLLIGSLGSLSLKHIQLSFPILFFIVNFK